jgi:hypothetical protein
MILYLIIKTWYILRGVNDLAEKIKLTSMSKTAG